MSKDWGCEIRAPPKDPFRKLESFHHKAIRQILQIELSDVRDEHIKNEHIRKTFNLITTAEHQIMKPQPTFVGKLIREDTAHPALKALATWIPLKRVRGRPHLTTRKSIISNLNKIPP